MTAPRKFPGLDTTVRCTDRLRAERPAAFKVAAWWQGGAVRDLKTFGFADEACLERVFRDALRRAAAIPRAAGEELGPVCIFDLAPGVPAGSLCRREDLERRFSAPAQPDPLVDQQF